MANQTVATGSGTSAAASPASLLSSGRLGTQSTRPVTALKRPSFSIRGKSLGQNTEARNDEKRAAGQNVAAAELPDLPVSEDGVRICWKQFATALPKEESAMAGRLLIIRPSLKDGLVVNVVVDNRMVASDIHAMRPRIEAVSYTHLTLPTMAVV